MLYRLELANRPSELLALLGIGQGHTEYPGERPCHGRRTEQRAEREHCLRGEVPISHVWLFYSDVWHPFWKATVNGEPTEVFKANLAYKAIQLKAGDNNVHFYFQSKLLLFLYRFLGLNALFWFVMLLGLSRKIILGSRL